MWLTKAGEQLDYRGKALCVGSGIYATSTDFEGLYGTIQEIRHGSDQLLCDGPPEILCSFYPPINGDTAEKIMRRYLQVNGNHLDIRQICEQKVILHPSQLRSMRRCRIYQVQGKDFQYLLQPYKRLEEYGLSSPKRDAYHIVYDGQLPTDDLEEIYYLMNCNPPAGYSGWPLTTSDVVELYEDSGSEFYYCDMVGWVKFKIFA